VNGFAFFKKYFFSLYADYPFYPFVYPKVIESHPYKISLYTDQFSKKAVKEILKIPGVHDHLPVTYFVDELSKAENILPINKRKIKFLYIGSYTNPEEIRSEFKSRHKEWIYIFDSLIDSAAFNYYDSFIEIACSVFKEYDLKFNLYDENVRNLLYFCNQYIRFKRRNLLIEKISNYPAYFVISNNQPSITFHPKAYIKTRVNAQEMINLMGQSCAVIMSLPNFAYGHSERMLTAMHRGCVTISSTSTIIEDEFEPERHYLRLDPKFDNVDAQIEKLENNDRMEYLVNSARKAVKKDHGPDKVIQAILKHLDQNCLEKNKSVIEKEYCRSGNFSYTDVAYNKLWQIKLNDSQWLKNDGKGRVEYCVNFLKANIIFSNESKLLDVGCGKGTLGYYLNSDKILYGIDISKIAISEAIKTYKRADALDIDRENLPYENNFFDIVVALDVIEHVFDPISMLKEAYRVLKRGGKFILSTPNILYEEYLKNFVRNRRFPKTSGDSFPYDGGHIHFFTYQDIYDLMNQIGFRAFPMGPYKHRFDYEFKESAVWVLGEKAEN
jgi:2-polyprenyl-3-methyl-5-hydroxy-6-metoxy-1,4-benzoquinol methylase